MAVNLVTTYPGRVDAADAEYPFGKPRNRVSPGDGTPFDEALYRDYVGMMAAVMRQSGITAVTNIPEKVGASEMLQGIARHAAGGSVFMEDSGVADAYVIDVPGTLPNVFESPSVLFDGMTVRWIAANPNTGASTLDVEFQGVSISSPQALTLEGGAALSGGEINSTVVNEARFDLGNSRFELTKAAGIGGSASIFGTERFHVADEKVAGTNGSTISVGSFGAHDFNTVKQALSGASLAANQVTLDAGTWFSLIYVAGRNGDRYKSRLRNITDTSTIISGSTMFGGGAADAGSMFSFIAGSFVLAATKTLEIQHRADGNLTFTSSNYGEVENYGDAMFWRIG